MPDDILFRLDRNWLTSSGAGDLATFGVLPQTVAAGSAQAAGVPTFTSAPPAMAILDASHAAPITGGADDAPPPAVATTALADSHASSSITPVNWGTGLDAPRLPTGESAAGGVSIPIHQPVSSDAGASSASSAPPAADGFAPATSPSHLTPDFPHSPLDLAATDPVSLPLPDVAVEQALTPGIVTATIGAADDRVDDALDLLGTDPAGGIATLVSLVTVTDLIDLRDADADVLGGDPQLTMIDSLAADGIFVDPLFAEAGQHDAAVPNHVAVPDALDLPDLPVPHTDLPIDPTLGLG